MSNNPNPTRRSFLQGAAALAMTVSVRKPIHYVQQEAKDYEKIFKDIPLIDQSQRPLDLQKTFKDKKVLLAFGYGGCPICEEMNKTLAATQKKLTDAGYDVPILVISVQPENEQKKEGQLADTVKKFHTLGLKSKSGAFILALPQSAEAAQELQKRIAEIAETRTGVMKDDRRQHSRFITLLHDGEVIKPKDGPFVAADLDLKSEQFLASAKLIEAQSARILDTVQTLVKSKAPSR